MAKNGLGKGLGALIESSLSADDAASVAEVPLAQIQANPYQPRKYFADSAMAELADSIREHGIIQPVIVKRTGDKTYELVAGERRVRAAHIVGLTSVPAIVRAYERQKMLEVALIENLQREDINPVDAATAYDRLRTEFNLTQEEIARRVGKAQSTVANTLRLLTLPKNLLDSLSSGDLSEGHARAVLQIPAKVQLKVWEEAKTKKLSVREMEKLAGRLKKAARKRTTAALPQDDPNFRAFEDALQANLGTKVKLSWKGNTGKLEIEFYSQEHLEAIVEKLIGGV